MSTDEILSGLPLWAKLPSDANNAQIPAWNSTTGKWEAITLASGSFSEAADYYFTGQNFFANDVFIGTDSFGDDTKKVATLGNLSAYASLTADEQIFLGQGNRFEYPICIGADTAENQVQTWQQVNDTIALAISVKADTSVLTNYAAKASANIFTANQTINANLAVGGTFTATARHHVRGDGTNPIARFDNNSGTNIFTVSQTAFGGSLNFDAITFVTNTNTLNVTSPLTNTASAVGAIPVYSFTQGNDNSTTASTSNFFRVIKTINPSTGSTNFRNFIVEYTINASGAQTGNATGIFLNATQTNLNGMTHNLLDFQVNSGSTFRVNNSGTVFNPSGGNYNNGQFGSLGKGFITFVNNGVVRLDNASENGFSILQFGGNTVNQPAIKPNGAGIDFVLASDTGFATIRANAIIANSLIRCGASTTNSASFNIPAGTAPTTPTNGDIWFDGTDNGLKIRINGVTRTITIS
jgi:hypothetical protein